MKGVRTLLTGFLLVAAFLLSFGALRHRALEGGIIHGDLGVPFGLLDWRLSAHTLAGVWALALDGLTAVGVLGVRDKRTRDWRAWVALVGGLGLSLLFQTSGYDEWAARGMAAVPPLALAMAVWIFEVPGKPLDLGPPRTRLATEARPPVPARLRAWLGSWDQAGPVPAPVAAPLDHPAAAPLPTPLRTGARRPVRALTDAERRKVDPLVQQGLAPLAISKRLRLPYAPVRIHVRELEAASRNGERP